MPLGMRNSSFAFSHTKSMNSVYDHYGKEACYEPITELCANCFVIATLRDYALFLSTYKTLLTLEMRKQFIYYAMKMDDRTQEFTYFPQLKKKLRFALFRGAGDFSKDRFVRDMPYRPLSNSFAMSYIDEDLHIVMYTNSNIRTPKLDDRVLDMFDNIYKQLVKKKTSS